MKNILIALCFVVGCGSGTTNPPDAGIDSITAVDTIAGIDSGLAVDTIAAVDLQVAIDVQVVVDSQGIDTGFNIDSQGIDTLAPTDVDVSNCGQGWVRVYYIGYENMVCELDALADAAVTSHDACGNHTFIRWIGRGVVECKY